MRAFSPSRLVAYSQCGFKPRIEAFREHRALAALQLGDPGLFEDTYGRAKAGDDFEDRLMVRIEARTARDGGRFLRIPAGRPHALASQVPDTVAAMAEGYDVIAQAPLAGDLDGNPWHGRADLLVRTASPSAALGTPWRYEVVDIKLARNASGAHLVQLAVYADLLDLLQGPRDGGGERVGLVTGGERFGDVAAVDPRDIAWFRRASVAAFGRLLRARYVARYAAAEALAASGAAGADLATVWGGCYPDVTDHCAVCRFAPACASRRESDRHASLVAGLGSTQRHGIRAAGVAGSAPLGELSVDDIIALGGAASDEEVRAGLTVLVRTSALNGGAGISTAGLDRHRRQAELQCLQERTAQPEHRLVAPSSHREPSARGYARLPDPSPFDLFLDLEGFPNGGIVEAPADTDDPSVSPAPGLDYLWGVVSVQGVDAARWREVTEPEAPTPANSAGEPHAAYLSGAPPDPARPRWDAWWAHDPAAERVAMQAVLARILQARTEAATAGAPPPHVYHYGHYEVTRLKQLTGRHGAGEAELTDLLRDDVFINLYGIARDVVRIGARAYSLKDLEHHYRAPRQGALGQGTSAIVHYSRWVSTDPEERSDEHEQLLREIAHYNRDDCVSTWQLRQWLLELRRESLVEFGPWPLPEAPPARREPEGARADRRARMTEVAAALVADLAAPPQTDAEVERLPPDQRVRWLVAGLLRFHRIESNNDWWSFFARRAFDDDERFRDQATLTDLKLEGPVREEGSKLAATFSLPPQPGRERDLQRVESLDADDGPALEAQPDLAHDRITLRLPAGAKGDRDATAAFLAGLHAVHATPDTVPTDNLEERLFDIGDQLLAGALRDPAVRAVLQRELPRAGQAAAAVAGPDVDDLKRAVLALDRSDLAIQGPPGTGKSYAAAHMICEIVARNRANEAAGLPWQRLGVMGPSNAVIDHLLERVARTWAERHPGEPIRILRKTSEKSHSAEESAALAAAIEGHGAVFATQGDTERAAAWLRGPDAGSKVRKGPFDLIGGTAWLFAAPKFHAALSPATGREKPLSHLVVDEAGQMTMANLLPALSAADNLVLVGDPQQLPQVTKGTHAAGVNVSALRHVMGPASTIDPARGVLLDVTRRMHPSICAYVSDTTYDGLLRPARLPDCDTSLQRVPAAAALLGRESGCVWVEVEHSTCATKSPLEADEIHRICAELLGTTAIDARGATFTLRPEDFLVIAPYNDQVELLTEKLRDLGITEVGTVDRFQGREATVALCSLTTSTRERAPRGLGFLLDARRLNVAVSRARTLAVVVGSPHLLASSARSVEDVMRLTTLAAFVEHARR